MSVTISQSEIMSAKNSLLDHGDRSLSSVICSKQPRKRHPQYNLSSNPNLALSGVKLTPSRLFNGSDEQIWGRERVKRLQ